MRAARALVIGIVAGLLAALVACGDDADPNDAVIESDGAVPDSAADVIVANDGADASDGGPRCKLPYAIGRPECDLCLATRCCAPLEACEADSDCRAFFECVTKCQGGRDAGGCNRACEQKTPAGIDLYREFNTCGAEKSPTACGDDCGML